MRKIVSVLACTLLASSFVLAQTASAPAPTAQPDPWAGWRFLVGDWAGEGGGKPGAGSGTFSFQLDLGEKILVRRNHAEYPAAEGRPASRHDDLMIVYPDGKGMAAAYFDSEGHVLHYAGALSADGRRVTFVTAPDPSAPRFRLTYTKAAEDGLTGEFEVAPPGQPEAWKSYLQWTSRRTKN
ncbi:MAG TPA: hypothetical protein VOA87_05705 [Thermoanaerobaculia bacterium]|nr:hypothetical protein [Thermoanaerobaculia bacterium]